MNDNAPANLALIDAMVEDLLSQKAEDLELTHEEHDLLPDPTPQREPD